MNNYNIAFPNSKQSLVLFKMAISHIVKIVRVISNPNGHVLLIGVGGSGRKSLTTLATFIAHMSEPSCLEGGNWAEDMQNILKTAGLE